jgi:phage tail sheath protein FI
MSSDFNHGVRVIEVSEGTRYARTVETGIIGMVCTAPDADPEVFPTDTPIQLVGASRYLDKAGEQGTLARALDAIKDQCEPIIHLMIVPEGATLAETKSNILGGMVNGRRTGLQGLLTTKANFGDKARILGVPFYDTDQAIAAELDIISSKLRAFNYCAVNAQSMETAVTYRANFGNRRKMLIWPEFTGWDTASNAEQHLYASARALGLRAKIDNEIGWHKTISNIEVQGVTGITHSLFHDPTTSEPTDTRYLNSHEVTTLIRDNGFKFWGNRTCSADPLFAFENYVRTADVLADTMALGQLWATDKPMNIGLLKDIIYTARSKLSQLTQQGYLLGGTAWFNGDMNPKELIKEGKATIDYDYTPVPPMEDLILQQRITDSYIVNLIEQAQAL